MAQPYDIVGYTFRADTYCPECIIAVLPTGESEAYDGWALGKGVAMSTEANLDEIAAAFGIDRQAEETFDSGDFPKVIFRDMLEADRCGRCHRTLEE